MAIVSATQSALVSTYSANSDYAAKQQEQAAQTTVKSTADKVEVSAAAQARLLKKSGESINQIASELGTTTKVVEDYLGETEQAALQQLLASQSR